MGGYPPENYDLAKIIAVQSTFIALVAIWVAFGAGVVGSGGIALCVSWIIKDLSVLCYNKVFPVIEDDLKKFEEWAKNNNVDIDKATKDIANGKQSSQKDVQSKEKADESLFGAIAKAGAKLVGKGAAKAAGKGTAKGATTLTGKLATKLAPAATKGARKVAAKALKVVRKMNPKTAKILKDGFKKMGVVFKKKGITMEVVLAEVGDYISNAYVQANEEDKKILDVMKEDFKNATDIEDLKEMLFEICENLPEDMATESRTIWIPINTRWILI